MQRFVILFSLMLFSSAFAQEPTVPFQIKQILLTEDVVVVTGNEISTVEVGNKLLATFADGSQCSMSVKSKSESFLVVSLSNCAKKNELKVQQSLEKALYQSDEKTVVGGTNSNQKTPGEVGSSTVQTSADIQSLAKLTPSGAFDFSLGTKFRNTKTEVPGIVDTNNTSYDADVTMSYGWGDLFSLGVKASYLLSSSSESSGTTTTASGVEDPTLMLAIQPMKQGEGRPLNLIVQVAYSPKAISAEYDNGGKGYSTTQTVAVLSRFFESAEVGVALSYSYSSEGQGQFKDGTTWKSLGSDGYSAAAYAQLRVSDFMYAFGAITLGQNSEEERSWNKSVTGPWTLHINPYNYTQLSAGLKFVVVPETSLVSVTISNQKVSQGSAWIRNNNTVNRDIDKLESTSFAINWGYRF